MNNRLQAGRAIAEQRAFDTKLSAIFAKSLPRKAAVRGGRVGDKTRGDV